MTSFKFPPPPPPPPKASLPNDVSSNTCGGHRSGQGQGRGRGRGERGRARGTLGRGRGNFGGAAGGGHDARDGARNAQSRGDLGGFQQQNAGRGSGNHRGSSSSSPHRPYQQSASQLPQASHNPSSTYRDPTLSNPILNGNQAPPADNTLAQAMSFMATPAGMQSMAAFASHMAGVNSNSQLPFTPVPQTESSKPQNSTLPSGHKRKWADRSSHHRSPQGNPPAQRGQQPSKKPPRAKCNTAPEIPSFGFTIPQIPTFRSTAPPKPNTLPHKRKPRVNLGLGQSESTYESSDEEEGIDEETTLAAKYKVEGVVFEHNGESISLQTPAEVAAWIKDRRQQFPTQKRIAQKAEEEAIQRASELEFLRKIKGQSASMIAPQPQQKKRNKKRRQRPTHLPPGDEKVREDDSRTEVKDGALEFTPKFNPVDLGLGYASDTGSDSDESSILSDSSVLSSSSESSDDTDSDPEDAGTSDDDSDAPPESRSTKEPIVPVVVPPPQQTVSPPQPKKIVVCESWQKNGKCKYGKHCRNLHPEEGNDVKRVGLYERLVEQELEKTDKLALDAIKYLGRNGFLG